MFRAANADIPHAALGRPLSRSRLSNNLSTTSCFTPWFMLRKTSSLSSGEKVNWCKCLLIEFVRRCMRARIFRSVAQMLSQSSSTLVIPALALRWICVNWRPIDRWANPRNIFSTLPAWSLPSTSWISLILSSFLSLVLSSRIIAGSCDRNVHSQGRSSAAAASKVEGQSFAWGRYLVCDGLDELWEFSGSVLP